MTRLRSGMPRATVVRGSIWASSASAPHSRPLTTTVRPPRQRPVRPVTTIRRHAARHGEGHAWRGRTGSSSRPRRLKSRSRGLLRWRGGDREGGGGGHPMNSVLTHRTRAGGAPSASFAPRITTFRKRLVDRMPAVHTTPRRIPMAGPFACILHWYGASGEPYGTSTRRRDHYQPKSGPDRA